MRRTPLLLTAFVLSLLGAGVRSDVPFMPATFRHSLLDPKMVPNGHKPKVIGNFSGTGRGDVAVMTVGEGMKLYRFPAWTQSVISPIGEQGGEDAQVADINRDGAQDIIVGSLFNQIFWLENPRPHGQDPYATRWKEHVINKGVPSHDIVVGDINGDGKVDVAVNGGLFLQNTPDSWTVVGKPQIDRGAEGTALGALTGDKYLDLLAPSPDKPYRLCWFENPMHHGDPARDVWTRHDIGPGYEQMAIAVADLNGDGRLDVLMAPMYGTGGLVWFEAPRDPRHGAWTRHIIDPTIQFVHQGSLQVADFKGDGRPDIAFAEQEQSQTKRVGVFYETDRRGLHWQQQILTDKGGHNLKVGRIGHDRLPSILCANHGFFGAPNPVELWRNQTAIRR